MLWVLVAHRVQKSWQRFTVILTLDSAYGYHLKLIGALINREDDSSDDPASGSQWSISFLIVELLFEQTP